MNKIVRPMGVEPIQRSRSYALFYANRPLFAETPIFCVSQPFIYSILRAQVATLPLPLIRRTSPVIRSLCFSGKYRLRITTNLIRAVCRLAQTKREKSLFVPMLVVPLRENVHAQRAFRLWLVRAQFAQPSASFAAVTRPRLVKELHTQMGIILPIGEPYATFSLVDQEYQTCKRTYAYINYKSCAKNGMKMLCK